MGIKVSIALLAALAIAWSPANREAEDIGHNAQVAQSASSSSVDQEVSPEKSGEGATQRALVPPSRTASVMDEVRYIIDSLLMRGRIAMARQDALEAGCFAGFAGRVMDVAQARGLLAHIVASGVSTVVSEAVDAAEIRSERVASSGASVESGNSGATPNNLDANENVEQIALALFDVRELARQSMRCVGAAALPNYGRLALPAAAGLGPASLAGGGLGLAPDWWEAFRGKRDPFSYLNEEIVIKSTPLASPFR